MAVASAPRGPRPLWYDRLPPALRRVAAESDRVRTLPLRRSPALGGAAGALEAVLSSGRAAAVGIVAQRIADAICAELRVARVRVEVAERRPWDQRGELHGLYQPGDGRGRPDVVTLWMRTAKRGQVVAYRTFLRTLLHELCHHLDYTYLHLHDSLHTQGFYQRESSLFASLGVPQPRR